MKQISLEEVAFSAPIFLHLYSSSSAFEGTSFLLLCLQVQTLALCCPVRVGCPRSAVPFNHWQYVKVMGCLLFLVVEDGLASVCIHMYVCIYIYISEVIPLIPLLAVLVQLNIYRRSNNFDLKQSFSVLPLNTREACFWEKGSSWTLLLEYTSNNIIGAINKK